MTRLDRQIRLLEAYGVFTYPFACVPFLFFYFLERGIELDTYMWLIALYYWAMVAMEIPTGVLADRFGRKTSLVAGSGLLAAGFLTIYFGDGFTAFATGELLFGVGHSLLSGAPTAMLFDALRANGRGDEFLRIESRVHSSRLLGTGAAFLLGGVLAHFVDIRATILATACLCATGAVLACFLSEPKNAEHRPPALLRAALSDLRSRPLLWLLVYFVLLFALLRFAFHTYQPYVEETVFDESNPQSNWLWIGVLFAALNLVAAPCSRLALPLRRRFRYRSIFFALPLVLCLAFLVMAELPGWLGIAVFFVHQVPFGLHWALVQEFVNQRISTVSRATALSIVSFVGRLSFAAVIPLVGAFEVEHGTPRTYFWVGVVGLGVTILWCSPGLGARLLARDEPRAEPAVRPRRDDSA